MGNALFLDLLTYLNSVNPVYIALLELILVYSTVLLMFKLFGKEGLFVYVAISYITANIQVLKMTCFPLLPEPLPLGTIVFASTYVSSDIINRRYGKKEALKLLCFGFASYLIFMLFMSVNLSFQPLTADQVKDFPAGEESYSWALSIHDNLMTLFAPAPSLFISSIAAFLASQATNILIFARLAKKFRNFLGTRSFLSSAAGTLIDETVFSFCAFYFLAKDPMDIRVLLGSYISATFIIRMCIVLIEVPILKFAVKITPRGEEKLQIDTKTEASQPQT